MNLGRFRDKGKVTIAGAEVKTGYPLARSASIQLALSLACLDFHDACRLTSILETGYVSAAP